MPRAHHPVATAPSAARYAPTLADSLNPLAHEVGKALAHEMKTLNARPVKGSKKPSGDVSVVVKEDELGARISALVAKVLHQPLTSPTERGKALRMALIARLANAEIGLGAAVDPGQTPDPDALLTTAEAAAKLDVSRPYISMLCDAGKLGEVILTEGGHRRIRSSAVGAYLAAQTRQYEGASSPRAAGVKAGLYDHADGHFSNVIRGADVAPAVAKPARKRRS